MKTEWGKRYDEPSGWDKFLAFLLRLIPPIGPLADLRFKLPTPQVEKLFMRQLQPRVNAVRQQTRSAEAQNLILTDENYDVGTITPAGQYFLADDIQAYWLHKLAQKNFTTLTPPIRMELTAYFTDLSAPMKIKQQPEQWKQLQSDYAALKATSR